MLNGKKWFAFFSHTGSEIVMLAENLGIVPDVIVTNNSPGDTSINNRLLKFNTQFKYTTKSPEASDYDAILSECDDECIVTLHGWMRIIPKEICRDYEIYNLHPGLITKYPELKGKDPQAKATRLGHDRVGVVIHRVTEHVDEGEILAESSAMNPCTGSLDIYLHGMAQHAWLEFFNHVLLK